MARTPEEKYAKVHQEAQRERAKVSRHIDSLLSLPRDEQFDRIHHSYLPLRSPAAVRELLRRSHEAGFRDYEESKWLAYLGLVVARRISSRDERIGSDRITYDYQALAQAQEANACRIGNDWQTASRLMREAFLLHLQGSGDIETYARLCSLRGSLLKDQRCHEDALTDLKVARTLYRQLGDRGKLIDVLLNIALVHSLLEEHSFAFRINSEALRLIDEEAEPKLAVIANCNEALFLTEMGEPRIALRSLKLFPALADLGIPEDSTMYAYRTWEAGKAKLALGYYRGARELLEEARSFFEARRIPFNQALVTLDLARLYHEAHKTDGKVYKAAFEALTLLRQQKLDREAWQALRLLAQAAAERALTATNIRDVIRILRGGRSGKSCCTC